MLLCLDAGNTRLKYGLHDGATWCIQGALDYVAIDQMKGSLPQPPQRIVACNVAGAQVAAGIEDLARRLGAPLAWLSSSSEACGVTSGYDNPAQLGSDRWAALIGARGLQHDTCVVVMAGTATTIDLLDAEGAFRGGLILPGLAMMRAAMARDTAGLPEARGRYAGLATNTDDAIVSGALHATLGAIARVRVQAGREATCLLYGGAAAELATHLEAPMRRVDNLVLEGLARYARRAGDAQ